jgi:hypothetical protein
MHLIWRHPKPYSGVSSSLNQAPEIVTVKGIFEDSRPEMIIELPLNIFLALIIPLHFLANIQDGFHKVAYRDNKKEQREDLPKAPLILSATFFTVITMEREFDIDKQDDVDDGKTD